LRDIGKTTEFAIEQDVVDEFLNPAIVTITEAIGSPEKRRLSITCVGCDFSQILGIRFAPVRPVSCNRQRRHAISAISHHGTHIRFVCFIL